MNEQTTDEIVTRVRKLLALAGNNPSEAEREAAMTKALAILADHGLTMTQIEGHDDEGRPIRKAVLHRYGPWIRTVYQAVSELYFCNYIYSQVGPRRVLHWYVGEEHNVLVAFEIAHWLSETLWREGRRLHRENAHVRGFLTSFLNGAASRLYERVEEIIAAARRGEQQSNGNNLPVLASLYDRAKSVNDKAARSFWDDLKSNNIRLTLSDQRGADSGRAFADTLNLGPQVGSRTRGRLK